MKKNLTILIVLVILAAILWYLFCPQKCPFLASFTNSGSMTGEQLTGANADDANDADTTVTASGSVSGDAEVNEVVGLLEDLVNDAEVSGSVQTSGSVQASGSAQ